MAVNKNGERIGVYLNNDLLKRCNLAMATVDVKSRSEFIRDALEHYITMLNIQGNSKVLTPALESVINGRISMTEDRLSRIIFKLGVESAMMNNLIAATNGVDETTLADLRKLCTNEVARIGGRYKLEDAVAFQKGGN